MLLQKLTGAQPLPQERMHLADGLAVNTDASHTDPGFQGSQCGEQDLRTSQGRFHTREGWSGSGCDADHTTVLPACFWVGHPTARSPGSTSAEQA